MPVTLTKDNTAALVEAVRKLVSTRVMVGIADTTAERDPEPGEKNAASNAVIGYVQEFGDPEKNIPARPFLVPGVESVRDQITANLVNAAKAALSGDMNAYSVYKKIGLLSQAAVRRQMTNGDFAPLSDRTIKARARRGRKGAKQYLKLRKEGVPEDILQGAAIVKPLIDTGQLRNAITFIIRQK